MGTLGMADAVGGQIIGLAAGGIQDARQRKQAKKLQRIQIDGQKEMGEYNNKLALDMWNKTNASAQVKHLEEAGLNVGLMYGGSGGGGATTGTGGGEVSGQSAGDPNAGVGMGMQMASQIALMKAQRENIEADTANKRADAGYTTGAKTDSTTQDAKAKEWENQVRNLLTAGKEAERREDEADIKGIEAEQRNAEWELAKAIGYENNFTSKDSPIGKAMLAGWEKTVTDLENAKKEGDIKKAQIAIENYKANLANEGIDPNSPWYLKIMTTLASKLGLSPTEIIKQKLK